MNKYFLAIFVCILSFASCKKSESSGPNMPAYHIDGISDVTLQKQPTGAPTYTYLPLSVVYENSDQERLTLSVEGVPSGLVAKFQSASGIPSFSSTLMLIDSGVSAGDYALNLVATGANSGKKTFEFHVTILPAPDCSGEVTGNSFSCNLTCGSSGPYTQNISAVAGTPSRVLFSNFDNTGAQVYGIVSCLSGQIGIPLQTVNGTTYQGNGNYATDPLTGQQRLYISFNRSMGGSTNYCNLNMAR